MLNCIYELNHLKQSSVASRIFGCTAGVRWFNGLGMVHVRNLDWPLTNLGQATRLFRFRYGKREFVAVGIVGYVGILSGMLPGRYSVTINWAPPVSPPTFNFGPTFLLREALEECDNYEEVVYRLKHTPLSTSVFFTVCGIHKGQACVIERTQTRASVRKLRGSVIVQANHHVVKGFAKNNKVLYETDEEDEESFCAHSERRMAVLDSVLRKIRPPYVIDRVADVLNAKPVLNENTYQRMIFRPSTGVVKVWRRLGD
jgi:predicted choloylglycine hydrolase